MPHAGACLLGAAGWKLSAAAQDHLLHGQGTLASLLGLVAMHAHWAWRHKAWSAIQIPVSFAFWVMNVTWLWGAFRWLLRLPGGLWRRYTTWKQRRALLADLHLLDVDPMRDDWGHVDWGLAQVLRHPCPDCMLEARCVHACAVAICHACTMQQELAMRPGQGMTGSRHACRSVCMCS